MTAVIHILALEQFMHRLQQEAERSLRGGQQFSILYVIVENADSTLVRHCLADSVRFVDTIGQWSKNEYAFIFPSIDEDAHIPSDRILSVLESSLIVSRGCLGTFPNDGASAESLLSRIRETALTTNRGTISKVPPNIKVLEIDGHPVIAVDDKTQRLFALVKNLSKSDLPVLIGGETGVGKEIVANALHYWSPRTQKKLVSINCAAMPETLLESELFGHEKGSFSGAIGEKKGLFEIAKGGTLFLDEISEASLRVQAGLLRVLETKKVRRVGAVDELDIDVRIISAANRDLEKDIKSGRFRRDLYFRLCAATVSVPRLRRRLKDLPELSKLFLKKACKDLNIPEKCLNPYTLQKMTEYTWPGNIRELKHLMEFLAATVETQIIPPEQLPQKIQNSTGTIVINKKLLKPGRSSISAPPDSQTSLPMKNLAEEIQDLERKRIKEALIASNGVRSHAATLIGMPLRTLVSKLKKYGLSSIKSRQRSNKPPKDNLDQ